MKAGSTVHNTYGREKTKPPITCYCMNVERTGTWPNLAQLGISHTQLKIFLVLLVVTPRSLQEGGVVFPTVQATVTKRVDVISTKIKPSKVLNRWLSLLLKTKITHSHSKHLTHMMLKQEERQVLYH